MLNDSHMYTALNRAKESILLPSEITLEILEDYFRTRQFWVSLKTMFKNYFNGEKPLINIPDFEYNHEILLASFSEYLALYNLFSFGWTEIEQGLTKIEFNIKTPGEALIYILREDAKQWVKIPKSKPETLYRAWLAYTVNDTNKFEVYYQRLIKQVGNSQTSEQSKFIHMCLLLVKKSKSATVKEIGKQYENTVLKHSNTVNRMLRRLW